MKRAVSISICLSKRDKAVEVTMLGEKVSIERLGTDGDMEARGFEVQGARRQGGCLRCRRRRFGADGRQQVVSALLGASHGSLRQEHAHCGRRRFEEHIGKQVCTLSCRKIGDYVNRLGRKVFMVSGADRWVCRRASSTLATNALLAISCSAWACPSLCTPPDKGIRWLAFYARRRPPSF